MEITEEQRIRAEANRLAALEKKKRAASDPWLLFRCHKIRKTSTADPVKISNRNSNPIALMAPPPTRYAILIEVCSPTEFLIKPKSLKEFNFPGEIECFKKIESCLGSVVPFFGVDNEGIKIAIICKINDHEMAMRCLKTLPDVELQDIPHMTFSVVRKFQECVGNQWKPLWDNWYGDDQVNGLLEKLPESLKDALLPFQLEGVRFGLRRGGRCLIADEMGLGKTIQAIATACCFLSEGPILVVCPAVLRYSWAEELEHWLPFLLPKDIHLVFGHQDNLNRIGRNPKVVVISYTMLSRLRKSMLERKWAVLIVDESHNLRSTKKKSESSETEAVIKIAEGINRIILLSGTPSLSRPFDIYHQINMLCPRLLGKDKYEFAKNYCSVKVVRGFQGNIFQDYSKGIRLEELNVLLSQTLMIRRLKEHVLTQLPPKRRQIINLKLKKTDMPHDFVMRCCSHKSNEENEKSEDSSMAMEEEEERSEKTSKELSQQEIGLAKLSGFREWFCNHAVIKDSGDTVDLQTELDCQKMVIFAHHLKVLDGIQEFICEKRIQFVRIDGSTLARDRQAAVETFRQSQEVKIAIIGITAGGVGLDFSSAQNVVFLELPKTASEMLQAEDRAHRRGQINAVNIYIFCAKDTSDTTHWLHLNNSLFRVTSMINGKIDAIQEIEVEKIVPLSQYERSPRLYKVGNGIIYDSNAEILAGVCSIKSYSDRTDECTGSSISASIEEENIIVSTGKEYLLAETRTEPYLCSKKHIAQSTIFSNSLDKVNTELDLMGNSEQGESKQHVINNIEGRDSEVGKADANCPTLLESLRFEVSQYTGRVHLYRCMQGKDIRPTPLSINFKPEDTESIKFCIVDLKNDAVQQLLGEYPDFCKIFQSFFSEWNTLRPIQQNKLFGKPLQLPLSLEICYLKESVNHGSSGLLKGGSKRRVTSLDDISKALPENAVWKKVAICSSTSKEKEYFQAWTSTGDPLCKLCQQQCSGKLAKKPEFFEDLFCNLSCFQEYRIRTSQKALRHELFRIEHGVCSNCKLDCHDLVKCIKPLSIPRRKAYVEKVAPKFAEHKKLFEKLVNEPVEGNAWHADHIIAVYKGGGECNLDNMRTLCVVCHADVTKAQQGERKLERQRAKQQLKIALKELQKSKHETGNKEMEINPDDDDDDLFVKIPGSAYSRRESC